MPSHAETFPFLREILIFLATAGIVVPLFHRLKVSPVLGYLGVGLCLGPYGLGLVADDIGVLGYAVISDPDGVRTFAEMGVVFLLFMIGLELSLARLWALRGVVLGLGGLQVVITAALIALLAARAGLAPLPAGILGVALAFSSTAMVMQLLMERRRTGSVLGRAAFGVLLLQDLAVVPMLAFLAVLGAGGSETLGLSIGVAILKAAAAMGVILAVGRVVLRPLFRHVSESRSPELFMAVTLLTVVGTAAATAASGLSMALGAFLAGLMLSESEYRHEVEVDIEPFKGLLLGLFFMSVGMGIDIRVLANAPGAILGAVAALFALKALVIALLSLAFGLSRGTAVEAGILLGQGGEFAFVILNLAMQSAVLEAGAGQFALLVVSLSMLLTPFAAEGGRRLGALVEGRRPAKGAQDDLPRLGELEGHVIVAGFGRVGQVLARVLDAENVPYVALDQDIDIVAVQRAGGRPVYFGNASRVDLVRRVRAEQAQALVVTMDDAQAVAHVVLAARREWPLLPIYARARDKAHAAELLRLGATEVMLEAAETSLQLAGRLLSGLGAPDAAVAQRLAHEREAMHAALHGGKKKA